MLYWNNKWSIFMIFRWSKSAAEVNAQYNFGTNVLRELIATIFEIIKSSNIWMYTRQLYIYICMNTPVMSFGVEPLCFWWLKYTLDMHHLIQFASLASELCFVCYTYLFASTKCYFRGLFTWNKRINVVLFYVWLILSYDLKYL